MVSTGNNMVKICDKYHSCCIENDISNAALVVFVPNFTVTHAITSIYLLPRIFGIQQSEVYN